MKLRHLFFASLVCSPLSVLAEESVTAPRPVPLTRPEMKRLLAHRVEVLTNVVLDPTMDDDDFLDAAAAAGAFRLVRR